MFFCTLGGKSLLISIQITMYITQYARHNCLIKNKITSFVEFEGEEGKQEFVSLQNPLELNNVIVGFLSSNRF